VAAVYIATQYYDHREKYRCHFHIQVMLEIVREYTSTRDDDGVATSALVHPGVGAAPVPRAPATNDTSLWRFRFWPEIKIPNQICQGAKNDTSSWSFRFWPEIKKLNMTEQGTNTMTCESHERDPLANSRT
jgi:hypothetical protein